ncbi:putative FtsK/SpoIIIE family protein [Actinoplanes missouriensis 431]|uniref:Putative FtsK/SpoIIIE family protein n=1 Tax=Actinoplanes missouriensis (strain ATCC 14538 / DSM 43046 / CBS 188.64 / JCM 3121 / NBRC 102363 / NCIMB 12654 / NRRL B-3342 / UNCC 431) TaxID=512565 RepID=I0HJ44_ACTM4|nr:type VII secretion protein EccC [Actinoplanes missouriensis]BAL93031.1 putative FtsK/SpoIIIE family protein [Actinoplanes missouriensis 431]
MGTITVRRPPRRPEPVIPSGALTIDPPPEMPAAPTGRWQQWLLALPMLGGTLAMALMMGQGQGGPYAYVVGGLFGISSLAMLTMSLGSTGAPRRAELIAARREYLRHLAGLRRRARRTARMQRIGLLYRHPDPDRLWSTVDSDRLWERRPEDADFGVVRIGLGPQSLATPLTPPATRPLDELEPMTAGALRRFLQAYAVVPDLPVAMSVRGFARVLVSGGGARALVRAALVHLAVFHAPDDLIIAVCTGPGTRDDWEWVKWLPHNGHPSRSDALGRLRLIGDPDLLDDLLSGRTGQHLVVVTDRPDRPVSIGRDGVTVLDLDTAPPRMPDASTLVLEISEDGTLHTSTLDDHGVAGRADRLEIAQAEAIARRLAPLRLETGPESAGPATGSDPGLTELLGIGDPPVLTSVRRSGRHRLRVPIGVDDNGRAVELDLKESAQDGMGPHGLIVGATGSGKSELLRTLVLALAATHSAETLNLVLIDFKGGATFASMDRLPHTAALITNLADALPLVDRMADALDGELLRRQELLRRSGNFAGQRDYERARAAGAALPPLPSLLVICDEFSELLQRKPEFLDLFLQIGRLGRSLGVHLLLASQRLEDGRLRGLDTHLSYRIGLRTFSALESRAVLGVPDAYELPRSPGHGYLRSGTEPPIRFRAAYVSGPSPRPRELVPAAPRVLPWTTRLLPLPAADRRPELEGPPLADVLVGRLAGHGPPAHRVWLPPLDRSAGLDDLLGPITADPQRGLTVANPALRGTLQVPMALVDKPREQLRDVLWLQLSGSAGHVAVAGGTRSGKSTALRTLVCGLALTHTPAEARVYALDFGGGTLSALRDLPHVGGVFGRLEPEGVRRTAGEMVTLLNDRERRSRPDDPHVFLVVDGWSTLRTDFEELEPILTDLATRGLAYRIHLVAAASRWTDFRPPIRDLFGSRVELRLGDPADSAVHRRAAAEVPEGQPGRGVTEHPDDRDRGLHLLTARPEVSTMGDTAALVEAVAAAWGGPVADPVRLLPAVVAYTNPGPAEGSGLRVPIGIAESDLRPVELDFAAEPHLLVLGDAECGKSSFLRALVTSLTSRFTPEQARVMLVDYRRGLIDLPHTEHRIGYGIQAQQTADLLRSAAGYMERRLPGPDVTPERLRTRSWWTGPELFVLVDDYDLVAAGPANPLMPLLDHLPQARDIGLHLVLTRRAGGAGRALYEPVIQRLRELSAPGLLMSGPVEEGALLGTVRAGPLPPGRAHLITRREGARLIQLAYLPPFRDAEKSADSACD